jgi:hypothetical protein
MTKARIRWDVNNEELEKSRKELREIQKQAGLTDEEVEKIGKSFEENTKQVKSTRLGLEEKGTIAKLGLAALAISAAKAFIDLSEEIRKSRKEVALLTNLAGKELDRVTAKVRATSKTFDKEFNEVLRAANTLSKEFDISMSDAIENIKISMANISIVYANTHYLPKKPD